MTVRPTSPGQTPQPGIRRTDKSGAAVPAQRPADSALPAAAPGVRRDDVQISAQARELHQLGSAGLSVPGEIAPERLRTVLDRLAGGYYDQPKVRDEVLRRLTKDL